MKAHITCAKGALEKWTQTDVKDQHYQQKAWAEKPESRDRLDLRYRGGRQQGAWNPCKMEQMYTDSAVKDYLVKLRENLICLCVANAEFYYLCANFSRRNLLL